MVSYPAALDSFSNPTGLDALDNANPALDHDVQHAQANDAIEALQAKLGADGASYTFVPASATAGTAINAAIAALPSSGGMIRLGAGTHTINTAVLLSKNVRIEGVGTQATLLQFDASAVPTAIKMADTTQRRIHLQNFRLNTTTGSDNTGTGIDASYFFNSCIRDVFIGDSSTQTPNIGIDFNALGTYYNAVENCRISVGGASSIGIRGANNANDNAIRSCKITGDAAQTTCVQLNTAHSWLIEHLSADTAGLAVGIDLQTAAHDTTMLQCYLEGLAIGLKVASGVESARFVGGYIASSTTANIQDNGAVGLTVDNAWIAFDPYSSIDRAGTVKNRVNGVSVPGNQYGPDDFGLIAWNYDPVLYQAGTLLTNGTIYLARVKVRYATTITNLIVGVTAAAVTPVGGQSFLGLYDSAGNRVAQTADAGTALTTTGLVSVALTAPYAAAAGDYWVAVVANAATAPTLARVATGVNFGILTLGTAAASRRFATNGTGATSLPSTITPSANSTTGAISLWVAAS